MEEQNMEEKKLLDEGRKEESRFKDPRFNFIFILILGVLLGIAIKTEATKRITHGFMDYSVETSGNVLSINEIQKELLEKEQAAQENQEEQGEGEAQAQPVSGETCGI